MNNAVKNKFEGFLQTHSLWNNSELLGLKQFDFPEIIVSDHPEITDNIPQLSDNFVLGKRIESFFIFALQLSHQYRILAQNLQIIDNKITLGEIDFLVEDKISKEHLHVEVVYKFYLYDPKFKLELERWIGPNRKDDLLRKLNKIKDHQFPILYNRATKSDLETLNLFSKNFSQEVCFKANLFTPLKYSNKILPYVNNACISGYWITFDEFNEKDYSDFLYFAPNKMDWPVKPEINEVWYSFDKIRMQIQELFYKNKSPLIWMKKNKSEFERFFVVWW